MGSTILSKEELQNSLYQYYKEHYGERDTDIVLGATATNVFVFEREGNIYALKCHILTGKVEACVY